MVTKPDSNKARLKRHKRVRGKISGVFLGAFYLLLSINVVLQNGFWSIREAYSLWLTCFFLLGWSCLRRRCGPHRRAADGLCEDFFWIHVYA